MKVLQIIDIGYEAGGAEKTARITRDYLQQLNHDVFILSTDINSNSREMFANLMVPMVRGGVATRLIKYFWNYEAYRKVRATMRGFNPDVVHLHTICEFSPSVIWGIGKTPAILTVHGPEEFTLRLLPWLLPSSDYNHDSYQWKDIRLIGRLRYSYLRYIQRPAYLLALKKIKMIVVPSKFMARTVARDFPRTPTVVLYPEIIVPEKHYSPLSAHPTVLFVGRLELVKGVDYLIRAFARVHRYRPESRLRIVGDGSQRLALENLARELGIDYAVEFTGWVKPGQIHQEYTSATLVAIPSVCPEALGLVGLEALALGLPIVGSNTGGIPELIDIGITGAVVEPRDEGGLAEAIDSFLFNEDRLAVAARASVAKARELFSHSFIEKQLELYQQAINANLGL
jgi:glycosyltransferase involved in cell wall biosynthesis